MHQHPNKEYKIFTIPINYEDSWDEFSKESINEHFNWFLSIKDIRLNLFCDFVFMDCPQCLDQANIGYIEHLFCNLVSVSFKTKEQLKIEIDKIALHLRPYAKPTKYKFDERTISLCYDIAIFLGELIISLDSKIKWQMETDKRLADYGRPVLIKKGVKLRLNPFTVTRIIASKIYDKEYKSGEMESFFNYWKLCYEVT